RDPDEGSLRGCGALRAAPGRQALDERAPSSVLRASERARSRSLAGTVRQGAPRALSWRRDGRDGLPGLAGPARRRVDAHARRWRIPPVAVRALAGAGTAVRRRGAPPPPARGVSHSGDPGPGTRGSDAAA